ncbi:MAG: lipopolysaccharide biosynthesis protein [Muribaculaceae bacterium]|nr:lipopolysaccharide biosynthesis protein [Muribaculaceae bacterium]MDE6461175.1 lipopolysaccharide biosynthesis protein [Muribaculaceae bacterium]
MGLKEQTAGTIKWNLVDKVVTQLLYALTGIVLARQLSTEDFGLVGAALVVQAFALMFVDSGFASALLQRKSPDERDYSTVFWFNMGVSTGLYVLLWFAAPLIAWWFHSDELVPLCRVMFLSLPLNALGIVQQNRLVKRMNVRPVAVSNVLALSAGSVAGIAMALTVANAWAIVVQTLVNTAGRSLVLWIWTRWRPSACFSWSVLRSYFKVGSGVMAQSFLNNVFLNVYGIFIGNRVGMVSLGLYSQADKWSKMIYTSVMSTLTTSFLPALAEVRDDHSRLMRVVAKMNRFSSYVVFIAMGGVIIVAEPLFHLLFGSKWDASIILFQLLLLRGIFTTFTSLFSNYILAMGNSRMLVITELVRDGVALAALVACFPVLGWSRPDRPVYGLELMLYGQLAAAVLMWGFSLYVAARSVGSTVWRFLVQTLGSLLPASVALVVAWRVSVFFSGEPLFALVSAAAAGLSVYLLINLRSSVQKDLLPGRNKNRRNHD